MTIRTTLFLLLAISNSIAGAQTFNPERKYAVGDNDAFAITVNATTSAGAVDVVSETTRNVKKVYDNGDADIETAVSKVTISLEGTPLSFPNQSKPATERFNRYGASVSETPSSRGISFIRFATYFGDKELKVGEASSFEHTDQKNANNHLKGTAKLVSLEDGKATLAVTIDSTTEGADKPMHLEGIAVIDATTKHLLSFKGSATNLPPMTAGITVASAKFEMKRK